MITCIVHYNEQKGPREHREARRQYTCTIYSLTKNQQCNRLEKYILELIKQPQQHRKVPIL